MIILIIVIFMHCTFIILVELMLKTENLICTAVLAILNFILEPQKQCLRNSLFYRKSNIRNMVMALFYHQEIVCDSIILYVLLLSVIKIFSVFNLVITIFVSG